MDRRQARRFEFTVLVIIIAILASLLLQALENMRTEFEEATMQTEAAALRVELLDRLAHHQAVGGSLPESRNPLDWVERRPETYLGERDAAPKTGGVWYFDRRRQELVYRFRPAREARFRLARGSETGGAKGSLGGIGLRRVDKDAL